MEYVDCKIKLQKTSLSHFEYQIHPEIKDEDFSIDLYKLERSVHYGAWGKPYLEIVHELRN